MRVSRTLLRRFWGEERGFTLPEIMVTIAVMGIVFAIAIPTWRSVQESRAVDSATNQLAADLRLAHSSATNQLTSYRLILDPSNPTTYRFGPSGGTLATRSLPDNSALTSAITATEFRPDGSARITGSGDITVHRRGGRASDSNSHVINIVSATSRVQIDP